MSFPLQNAEPSVAFKRGQFDFREVFDVLFPQFRPSSTSRRMDRRHSTLFFDRLFSPLNCVHAANHKSRKIAVCTENLIQVYRMIESAKLAR